MHTFAQKPKATQQTTPAKSTMPGRHFGQSPEVRSILHLQRTIGNQAVQRMLQTDAEESEADLTRPASHRFEHDFSRIPIHPPAVGPIQTKLAINKPEDEFEQEADRVSEQVMRMPKPQLQRACTCGGGCPKCQTDKPGHGYERLQMTHVGPGVQAPSAAPPSIHEVLRLPGQPLDAATRTFMEPRFGHDFSRVRIHTDAEAAQSAGQLHASAYTLGDHIVFAEGRLAPSTPKGDRLLAHELAHVVQGAGQNAILRRKPDPKGPHTQPDEARLRVKITDTLETIKRRALDSVIKAIERGDRAYLLGLQLTSRQVDDLLNRTSRFSREFGTALERQIELSVRANPDISNYVKKGPRTVPRGVGKPDWIIETPSSRIAVELTTVEQLEKKLKDWRSQHPKTGKPKWYVEKSLNLTYEIPAGLKAPKPPGTGVPFQAAGGTISTIAQVGTKTSKLRTAGRFLAREAPNLALQAAVMLFFPPGVIIHNDKIGELSQKKIDPPIQDILAKLGPLTEMPLALDLSRIIYGNVTVKLEYTASANSSGDLILDLKDATLLRMDISNAYLYQNAQKFDTSAGNPTKQITYSFVVYEPESVIREREAAEADRQYREWLHEQPNYKKWARAQKEYEECVQRYGTGFIPPPAGAEEASRYNPEAGPCIPPRMEPMEGP